MLIESKNDESADQENSQTIYTVLLPLLEGPFRAVLQGNDKNEIEICLESGEYILSTRNTFSPHQTLPRRHNYVLCLISSAKF